MCRCCWDPRHSLISVNQILLVLAAWKQRLLLQRLMHGKLLHLVAYLLEKFLKLAAPP